MQILEERGGGRRIPDVGLLVFDSEMTLEPFFKMIIKKVNNRVYNLRKIRKYITFDIAVQIYKQTILPYFHYGGFLCISLTNEKKNDFQIIQNDILRICNKTKHSDKVSIHLLHKRAKLIGLEQRRERQ